MMLNTHSYCSSISTYLNSVIVSREIFLCVLYTPEEAQMERTFLPFCIPAMLSYFTVSVNPFHTISGSISLVWGKDKLFFKKKKGGGKKTFSKPVMYYDSG